MEPTTKKRLTLKDLLENKDFALLNEKTKRKLIAIQKDKDAMTRMSELYASKYETEIAEGTLKRQLMITEGQKRGLKEEEVLQEYGKFIPSRYTPFLNFLYFFMRDEDDVLREERESQNQKYGLLTEDYIPQDRASANVDSPQMSEYVYGNITIEMFNRIKKLKALSMSDNENEAFQAYRACMRLCDEYDLDFNKIPCKIKK